MTNDEKLFYSIQLLLISI